MVDEGGIQTIRTIGILGGSFNPPHKGHLAAAYEAYTRLNLSEVWLLVSPQNPHKSKNNMADYTARVELCKLLAKGHETWLKVSTFEQEHNVQYTAQTLKKLTQKYTDVRFVWLMGSENLTHFHTWENWEDIIHCVPIACLYREEDGASTSLAPALQKYKKYQKNQEDELETLPNWRILDMPPHKGRATNIRNQLKKGEEAEDLTDEQRKSIHLRHNFCS